jgi:hypothetical protein
LNVFGHVWPVISGTQYVQNFDMMLMMDVLMCLQNEWFYHGWGHNNAWLPFFVWYGE